MLAKVLQRESLTTRNRMVEVLVAKEEQATALANLQAKARADSIMSRTSQ